MPTARNRLAFPIVIVVFAAIAGTLFFMSRGGASMKERAEAELFTPYFTAIAEARYADAWDLLSAERRGQWSLDAFRAHWSKLMATDGPIKRHAVYGARGSIVDYQLFMTTGLVAITYTVAEQDGRLRIATAVATSQHLAYTARPW
jgi:hypothetical protein